MARILYDNTGKIFDVREGTYDIPVGIPYLEINIPTGQYPLRVNVSTNPHSIVLSDPPRDPVAEKIAEMELRMAALEMQLIEAQELVLIGLEGAAETYETVYPFLPSTD
jgi:hypothetical protein